MSAGPSADEPRLAGSEHPERPRALGVWSLLALGVNGIVGVGIFFTPNLVALSVPGTQGVWAYALTLLALLPVAMTYARLGSRFDRDGGPYVWACAAFGEGAGFVVGFAAYASAVLSTSAVLAGLAEYTAPLLGFAGQKSAFSLLSALLFAGIVGAGLKPSAWVWSSLTVLKLLPLLLLVALFLVVGREAPKSAPLAPAVSWSRAVLLIVFSMQGFEIVPVPGSHVRSPRRTIPIATMGSLVLCAGLYMLLHWICVRAVGDLASSEAPLVAAARNLGGSRFSTVVSLGTNISAIGIAFGMMAMTPRYLAALQLGAGKFAISGSESPSQVPQRALFVTLVLVLILLSWGALSRLFVLSSVAVLFQYSVSVLSLGRLALERAHGLSPRDALWVPLALVALAVVARAVERAELLVMTGIVLVALLLGFVRVRSRK
ncbi:MAG TPA: APC family permease [Polyangiaceae bacterium]|nr:APC family permease [Polyangiaceae bacterium]